MKLRRRDAAKAAEQDLNAQGWLPTGWCALRQPLRLKKPLNPTLIPLTTLLNTEAAAFGRRRGKDMTMQYDLNRINS
nr:hypothetical protein [Enterobacter hormaechei]